MSRRFLKATAVAIAAAGCGHAGGQHVGPAPRASIQGAPAATVIFPPALTRAVTPFRVADENGTPYAHPFLGGFNIPRPQLVDIDSDGDFDLFVQETSSAAIFFENVGTPMESEFVWRTDQYGNLDIGEWYRFVDMDADGDADLLTEKVFSYITYYRNEGSGNRPAFRVLADTLLDASGAPIFSDRQNIPNVAEIDCDGNADLMIGRLVGSITRYEESGVGPDGAPRFRHVVDNFEGISIVAQLGSLHGANTLAFADIDGDGDQDLFWGDFFERGLLLVENTGSCPNPVFRGQPVQFPVGAPLLTSGYNAPTFADLDHDGDLDVLVGALGGAYNPTTTSADNLFYLENLGGGAFAQRTARFVSQIDVGSESIPVLVDLDADGDLDMLVANKIDQNEPGTSLIYDFENRGSATAPDFRLRGTWDVTGLYHYAPAFGDLDGDGDLDMMMGSWKDEIAFFRNRGSAAAPDFVLEDSVAIEITRGSNTAPALVDLDADGDLDLVIGESSGAINYYRNVGTATAHQFEFVSDQFQDIDVGRRSFPAFVDLDGDGDFDLVAGSETGAVIYYANIGTPEAPRYQRDESFALELRQYSTPSFADIDGDGDLDLFSGGIGGGVVYYENTAAGR